MIKLVKNAMLKVRKIALNVRKVREKIKILSVDDGSLNVFFIYGTFQKLFVALHCKHLNNSIIG